MIFIGASKEVRCCKVRRVSGPCRELKDEAHIDFGGPVLRDSIA